MFPSISYDVLVWVLRMVLGITFLYAGIAKLRDLPAFIRGVQMYEVLPPDAVPPLARLVPIAEIIIACALIAGWHLGVTAVAAAGLLGSFAAAVGVNLWRGRSIACHCFGASEQEVIGAATLLRLAVLGVAALFVASQAGTVSAGMFLPDLPPEVVAAATSMVVSLCLLAAMPGAIELMTRDIAKARRAARQRAIAAAADANHPAAADPLANGRADISLTIES